MKCDEQLPVCQNCLTSKRKCVRGVRLNFTLYTFYDPRESIPESADSDPDVHAPIDLFSVPRYYAFLDQSVAVSTYYRNGKEAYRPYIHLHSQHDLLEAARQMNIDCNSLKAVTTLDPTYISPAIHQSLPSVTDNSRTDIPYHSPYNERQILQRPHEPVQYMSNLIPGHTPVNMAQQPHDAFFLTDLNPLEPRENVILENLNITNLLANPELQVRASDFPMDYSSARPSLTSSELRRSSVELLNELPAESSVDASLFTDLIQRFRYYWLLDLFNEIHWWKVLIPNYCVRLAQAAEMEGKTPPGSSFLLIDSLLMCADYTSIDDILAVAHIQSREWEFFDTREVTMLTFRAFERVLLSVTLITVALHLQLTLKENLDLDEKFQLVLTNQGKLFHKLMLRLRQVPAGRLKKMRQSPLTVESIKAMTILRFMMKMNIQRRSTDFSYTLTSSDPEYIASSSIDYSLPQALDWSHFFTITLYEIDVLCNLPEAFDLPQISSFRARRDSSPVSDSRKLRELLWELVKADYINDNPQLLGLFTFNENILQTLRETDVNTGKQSLHSLVNSNERSLALNLLSQHLDKLHDFSSNQSALGCAKLFQVIDSSSIDKGTKNQWHRHFSWVLE